MLMRESIPIFCLMGPTASGKTQLAIHLTQQFPFSIISVDSAMIYRHMDIGTAKPSPEVLTLAPHRLIDIRNPNESYSAAQFRIDALVEIKKIISEKKIPLLVGGTMLYFRALQQGLSDMPSSNDEVRAKLNAEASDLGWISMHERLKIIDPIAAKRIHPNDPQRIQRALEVYELTGKNLTTWQQIRGELNSEYQFFNFAVAPLDRSILHDRIALRFQKMLDEGFVDEVKKLFMRGDLNSDMPSMRAVGYRQIWKYLAGDLTYEEMREQGIIATRQLAKRQLTWLRSWPDLKWFDGEAKNLFQDVENWISGFSHRPI